MTPDTCIPLWTRKADCHVYHAEAWERVERLAGLQKISRDLWAALDVGERSRMEAEGYGPCNTQTILLGEERPCGKCNGHGRLGMVTGSIRGMTTHYTERCPVCRGTGTIRIPTDPWQGEGLPVVDEEGRRLCHCRCRDRYSTGFCSRCGWKGEWITLADLRTRLFDLVDRLPHRWVVVTEQVEAARDSLKAAMTETQAWASFISPKLARRNNLTLCVPAGHDTAALRGLADLCQVGTWADGAKVTLLEGVEA